MTVDAQLVASDWVSALASAFESGDVSAATTLFLPDGWLRDLLVFDWNFRTLQGRDKITTHLYNHLQPGKITDLRLDGRPALTPRVCRVPISANMSSVEFGFRFDLPHGHCIGHARLVQDTDNTYRAFTVLMALNDLRGHEELSRLPLRDDVTGLPGRDMEEEFTQYVREVETNPCVLIVGGGQSGLHVAARLKQMNISSLVLEKTARVGDSWRTRYPTLTLHTVRRHHTMAYQSYPSTWPDFTPRDKLADWLEQYVTTQDLVVWTKSQLQAHPYYDESTGRWDVVVVKDGVEVRLHPAHIVFATGLSGHPAIPTFTGLERFRGQHMHSSSFPGGAVFAGRHAIVVGAGNSSIDICQDLALKGAASVTMVQRSSTCVIGREFFNDLVQQLYPEDEPLEISDLRFAALPPHLQQKLMEDNQEATMGAHKELYDNLRRGGLSLTMAHEGGGPYAMYFDNGGGYWLDKGGAELIGEGRIVVKSGRSIDRFTETGLVLSDGTELPADVVVFATGYTSILESNAEILGSDIMERLGPVGGLDEEGEVNGLFRPCGHPGLWFSGADFFHSRSFSKQLGLQIQAIEVGLLQQGTQRDK